MRLIWGALGWLSVGLAVIGAALPLMPTVPFLVLAAYAFARSSPRFHGWLMAHPVFGPQLHDWHAHRAISRRVKLIALASMAGSAVLGYLMLPFGMWLLQGAILLAAAAYTGTRPAPPGGP